jgi:hypothetical protein
MVSERKRVSSPAFFVKGKPGKAMAIAYLERDIFWGVPIEIVITGKKE